MIGCTIKIEDIANLPHKFLLVCFMNSNLVHSTKGALLPLLVHSCEWEYMVLLEQQCIEIFGEYLRKEHPLIGHELAFI